MCGHVRVLERLQLVGQLVGAEVELLVEGVDLALAVDALAGPLALRAAPPEPPVGAVARPAPSRSAAPGSEPHSRADVQPVALLRLVATGLCSSLTYRTHETAT